MRWLVLLIFIPYIGFSASFEKTRQENCSALDLRTEKLKVIRDQKKVAWCYAFTAADMLTYTYDLIEKASAADIAINYNDSDLGVFSRWLAETFGRNSNRTEQDTFMMPHQTGFNKIALERSMRDGYCPERVFPSESWRKLTREGSKWIETKVDLKSAMLDIFSLLKNQKNLTSENLPYYFHFKNIETPQEFFALIKGQSSSSFYSKLRYEVCKYDRIKYQDRSSVLMYIKDSLTFTVMNKQLNRGRVVGIDYDSRLLSDGRNSTVNLSHLHTSALVARRWSKESNECQYLVRDSYGKQCSKYDKSYECLGGQIWIDESKIYSNLTSFVYIIQ
jgi:hypothetical protein